ncbi:hypothetical protein VOA_000819 [Vibrio sp. RC586]|nr:hypothetical protein VOA_000819 [Vibrio sp. RC586]
MGMVHNNSLIDAIFSNLITWVNGNSPNYNHFYHCSQA